MPSPAALTRLALDWPALLAFYDRARRVLPWRAGPGETADPYRVWLSEIMLQQTTVAAVIPYFTRFTQRFPTLESLAAAPESEVLRLWAGLGYYARARNLHRAARMIAAAGGFPRTPAALRHLPGIGAYSAAAIAAIAFGVPTLAVDGNVARVLARLLAITTPLPQALAEIADAAETLAAAPAFRARPGDATQALFDLGAGICVKAAPRCLECPLRAGCRAERLGIAAQLPRRAAKPPRPERFGAQFWLTDASGAVLLRHRPARGLLAGMVELPGTAWREGAPWAEAEALAAAPIAAEWRKLGAVRHVFTHFALSLDVYAGSVAAFPAADLGGFARPVAALADEALPSVMRKCVRLAAAARPA